MTHEELENCVTQLLIMHATNWYTPLTDKESEFGTSRELQMKPTQEQVIAWAREAGLHIATNVHWMPIIGLEYLEKATALAYEAGRKDENEACAKFLVDYAKRFDDIRRAALEVSAENICAKVLS